MMMNAQTKETVAIKQCPTCAGELLARDRFCRHCGVNQNDRYVTAALTSDLPNCDTRPLGDGKATYQSLSCTLVNIVAQGLSAKSLSHRAGRGSTRLVAVIATVPIWLLIVLLSPVEAYAAARTITKRL
jgi:hypothetical protein